MHADDRRVARTHINASRNRLAATEAQNTGKYHSTLEVYMYEISCVFIMTFRWLQILILNSWHQPKWLPPSDCEARSHDVTVTARSNSRDAFLSIYFEIVFIVISGSVSIDLDLFASEMNKNNFFLILKIEYLCVTWAAPSECQFVKCDVVCSLRHSNVHSQIDTQIPHHSTFRCYILNLYTDAKASLFRLLR